MISGGKVTTPWYNTFRVPTWPGVSSLMNWENLFEVPIGLKTVGWKLVFKHIQAGISLVWWFDSHFCWIFLGEEVAINFWGVAKIQWNKSLWKREIVEAHPFSPYLHMEPASLFGSKRNLLVLQVDGVCVPLNTLTSAEMVLDFSWNGTIGWETIECQYYLRGTQPRPTSATVHDKLNPYPTMWGVY